MPAKPRPTYLAAMRRVPLLALLPALLVATCASPSPAARAGAASRGAELYARHCAVCHGTTGDGDTVAAEFLLPRPAAFRDGLFKLVSTTNGVPTEDDLVATLRRGMPGSTMMAWHWLPDADLRALAQHVHQLAVTGRAESIARTASHAGRAMTGDEARAAAARQLQPGPAVETGETAGAAGDAEEGARLYDRYCASCHGPDGRGLPATANWPTDGTWLWPRDFTAGYLRGGATRRELACRIRAGMPGARMPPIALSAAETAALVAHLQGMIPDTAAEHHVQWRRTLRSERLARLPEDGDEAAFARLEAVRLPTAPLWWRQEAVHEATIRVAHDGDQIVFRIEWADTTRDDRARGGASMGDGVAVQFARSMDPPLFAMGTHDDPVNVWRWHAFDPKETAGMVDLLGGARHAGLDVPIGQLAPAPRAESIELGGMASASSATSSGLPLHVATAWRDGRWTATFRRPLRARGSGEVDLAIGAPVLFALAIWNGAIDTSAASKSITTWHVLELQR